MDSGHAGLSLPARAEQRKGGACWTRVAYEPAAPPPPPPPSPTITTSTTTTQTHTHRPSHLPIQPALRHSPQRTCCRATPALRCPGPSRAAAAGRESRRAGHGGRRAGYGVGASARNASATVGMNGLIARQAASVSPPPSLAPPPAAGAPPPPGLSPSNRQTGRPCSCRSHPCCQAGCQPQVHAQRAAHAAASN